MMTCRVPCVLLALALCCCPCVCATVKVPQRNIPEMKVVPVEIPVEVTCNGANSGTQWRFPGGEWKECKDEATRHSYGYTTGGTDGVVDVVDLATEDVLMFDVSYSGREDDVSLSLCLTIGTNYEGGKKGTECTSAVFTMSYTTNESSHVYKEWNKWKASSGYSAWHQKQSVPTTSGAQGVTGVAEAAEAPSTAAAPGPGDPASRAAAPQSPPSPQTTAAGGHASGDPPVTPQEQSPAAPHTQLSQAGEGGSAAEGAEGGSAATTRDAATGKGASAAASVSTSSSTAPTTNASGNSGESDACFHDARPHNQLLLVLAALTYGTLG